jgi:hypothetical protein
VEVEVAVLSQRVLHLVTGDLRAAAAVVEPEVRGSPHEAVKVLSFYIGQKGIEDEIRMD